MRVLFDLRPQRLARIQEGHIDPLRAATVLFLGTFVAVSLFSTVYTALNIRQIRARLETVREEQAILAQQRARIDAEIGDLRAGRERIEAYADFLKEEMPSVEFLGALEGAVPSGVRITGLEMKQGKAVLRGVAPEDRDIIDLGGKLAGMKGIVGRVDAPVTAKTAFGGSVVLEFTMPCAVGTISEMALPSVLETRSADLAGGRAR